MSSDTTQGSGAASIQESGAPGAAGRDDAATESNRDEGKERALADLHKYKKLAKQHADEKSALAAELEALKTGQLKEKEDWKTLAEQAQKKAKEAEAKYSNFFNATIEAEKRNAIRAESIKRGIVNDEDSDLFPLDEVQVEYTSQGRFIVSGADLVVEAQKKARPHWFKNPNPPAFNGGGGGGAGAPEPVTAHDLAKIEKEKGRSSKEYVDAFEKFRKSKMAAAK